MENRDVLPLRKSMRPRLPSAAVRRKIVLWGVAGVVISLPLLWSTYLRISFFLLQKRLTNSEDVIDAMAKFKTPPDLHGDVALPKCWTNLSASGHIFMVDNHPGSRKIFFPETIQKDLVDFQDGKPPRPGYQISGYLYSDKPLTRNDWVDMSTPSIHVDSIQYWNTGELKPHWYYLFPYTDD
jgi:hypothetical protein